MNAITLKLYLVYHHFSEIDYAKKIKIDYP